MNTNDPRLFDPTGKLQRMSILGQLSSAALACLFVAGVAFAQPATDAFTGPKIRVAVMDLSGSALKMQTTYQPSSTTSTIALPPPAEFARGLTEMLTTSLVKTNKFVVLERSQIEKVIGEQAFGASGSVNAETAPVKGRIIGAQTLITGDITEFTYSQSSMGGKFNPIAGLTGKVDEVKAMVALDIRLVDSVTGEVLFSQRATGKASMKGKSVDLVRGDKGFSLGGSSNTPLGKASREALDGAVAAIVAGMKKVPWTGRVVDFREGHIYVNAGKEMGIQLGMEFDVYAPQGALVDPETGITLGTPDRKIGSVTVTAVDDKYSVAGVLAGEGFKRDQVVRFRGQKPKP